MKRKLITLFTALVVATWGFVGVGCDSNDGPLEKAGESLDEAGKEIGDGLEDAADEIEDAFD